MKLYEYTIILGEIPKIKLPEYWSFEDDLLNVTCEILQVDTIEIFQRCRREKVKLARWIIWEIMMACKGYTLHQAAEMFGDPYDHSSVIHGLNTLIVDLKNCQYLQLIHDYITKTLSIDVKQIEDFRAFRAFKAKDRKIRMPQTGI